MENISPIRPIPVSLFSLFGHLFLPEGSTKQQQQQKDYIQLLEHTHEKPSVGRGLEREDR